RVWSVESSAHSGAYPESPGALLHTRNQRVVGPSIRDGAGVAAAQTGVVYDAEGGWTQCGWDRRAAWTQLARHRPGAAWGGTGHQFRTADQEFLEIDPSESRLPHGAGCYRYAIDAARPVPESNRLGKRIRSDSRDGAVTAWGEGGGHHYQSAAGRG